MTPSRFVATLSSRHEVPSRHELGGKLLQTVEAELAVEKWRAFKHECFCTLIVNGWTTASGEHCLGWMAVKASGEGVLLGVQPASVSLTGEQIAEQTAQMFEVIRSSAPKAMILGMTSDSAGSFRSARKILQDRYSSKVFGACLAHQTNLCAKDIFRSSKKLQDVIDAVKLIGERISRSTRLRELLANVLGTSTISMSAPTHTRYELQQDISEAHLS